MVDGFGDDTRCDIQDTFVVQVAEFGSVQEALNHDLTNADPKYRRCESCCGPIRDLRIPAWFPEGYLFVEIIPWYEDEENGGFRVLKVNAPPLIINREVTLSVGETYGGDIGERDPNVGEDNTSGLKSARYALRAVIYSKPGHYVAQIAHRGKVYYYDDLEKKEADREKRVISSDQDAFLDRYGNHWSEREGNEIAAVAVYKRI